MRFGCTVRGFSWVLYWQDYQQLLCCTGSSRPGGVGIKSRSGRPDHPGGEGRKVFEEWWTGLLSLRKVMCSCGMSPWRSGTPSPGRAPARGRGWSWAAGSRRCGERTEHLRRHGLWQHWGGQWGQSIVPWRGPASRMRQGLLLSPSCLGL